MSYTYYGMTKTLMVKDDIRFSKKGWHRYKLDAVRESIQEYIIECGDVFIYTDTDSIKTKINR